ncbi:MAG TPA: FKBP-type peptidyl-prolyl cis-trans isomerase, partial [Rhodocyclaceae bacterium]|nr:FKBP-type peptidyl-prolyl cis-trans isomerase [Rhodocyclaceae bacterium]
MQIAKNTVVTLDYQVRDPDGNMIDDGAHPLVYLHGGYDGIFTVIEEALQGKNVGEQLNVKLQPDDAFGEYDEELVLVEDASLFPDNIEVGMSFERVG